MKKVNCTWKAQSFKDQDLVLDVKFDYPKSISPDKKQDILVVHFKNVSLGLEEDTSKWRNLFVTKESREPIAMTHRVLYKQIQR